jgi:hypothetical protein
MQALPMGQAAGFDIARENRGRAQAGVRPKNETAAALAEVEKNGYTSRQ